MNFYQSAMRNAAPILFVIACLLFVFSAVMPFLHDAGPFRNDEPVGINQVIVAIVSGLGAAVLPFFGAAICHLLGTRLPEATQK